MSVSWYSLGRCAGCGRDIIRWHKFRGEAGRTLSYVCGCSPKLEVMKRIVDGEGKLVVWDEIEVE